MAGCVSIVYDIIMILYVSKDREGEARVDVKGGNGGKHSCWMDMDGWMERWKGACMDGWK